MIKIKNSELKHKIEIIKVEQSVNEYYEPIEKETTLLKARAKILNISGKEVITSDKITSNIVKRFYIRYRKTDIDTSCKLKYNNKTYNITYVSDIEDEHKFFEIVGEI